MNESPSVAKSSTPGGEGVVSASPGQGTSGEHLEEMIQQIYKSITNKLNNFLEAYSKTDDTSLTLSVHCVCIALVRCHS